ncbi:hydroxyacid dehydrogenase [Orrella sp. JC864]|uniref:hydroxyacid dehydrogenase n=1 Tax=Orrella sp. JC864 TaxID=3120298 RepID=UPI00300B633B
MKIVCTQPMHHAGLALLEGHQVLVLADEQPRTLYEALAEADYLVVRSMLPPDVFEHPNRLRGVVRHGTGLDFIPLERATAHGIAVANVPGANAQAVVEYCLSAMLQLRRPLAAMDRMLRSEGWPAARTLAAGCGELRGKTLGVVGLGTIGSALALACHHGLGMQVLGYQPDERPAPDVVRRVALDALLAGADVLVLCCPLTEATRGLVNAATLARLRRGAILINAARGPIVVEQDLLAALRSGHLAGAALDVFERQPLQAGHPYLQARGLLLTPHVAGLTEDSTAAMSVGTAQRLLQMIAGQRPDNLVNPQVWNRPAPQGGHHA